MIIDTTISTADNHINKALRKAHRFFPHGVYENRKEQLEFRDLYVREFLESNGLDSDIDLRATIVFWGRDGEIVSVLSNSLNDHSQNIAALLV